MDGVDGGGKAQGLAGMPSVVGDAHALELVAQVNSSMWSTNIVGRKYGERGGRPYPCDAPLMAFVVRSQSYLR